MKMKFKFRKNDAKQSDRYCVEVSPGLRNTILKTGRIFIDWESCPVVDSLPLIRCFKCNGFGHKSEVCKQTEECCGHCGQTHKTRDCNSNSSQYSCVNCIKHNKIPKQTKKYMKLTTRLMIRAVLRCRTSRKSSLLAL